MTTSFWDECRCSPGVEPRVYLWCSNHRVINVIICARLQYLHFLEFQYVLAPMLPNWYETEYIFENVRFFWGALVASSCLFGFYTLSGTSIITEGFFFFNMAEHNVKPFAVSLCLISCDGGFMLCLCSRWEPSIG